VQDEASELDSASVSGGGIEGSIISVPDGPTMTAHEINTLSFTQAFAIHKVLPNHLTWRDASLAHSHFGTPSISYL